MSFPPNLGITNSFIIDSSCSLFQEFPSLLPHIDHICSPFSKHRMKGYSRINNYNNNKSRSKSVDFADLSRTPNLSKFKPTPDPYAHSIPEHEVVKRSASVTDRYARIHNHAGKCGDDPHLTTPHTSVKKKGNFFRAFKRFLGL